MPCFRNSPDSKQSSKSWNRIVLSSEDSGSTRTYRWAGPYISDLQLLAIIPERPYQIKYLDGYPKRRERRFAED